MARLLASSIITFAMLGALYLFTTSPTINKTAQQKTQVYATDLMDGQADRYVARMQAHVKEEPRCARYRQAMAGARKLGTTGSGAFHTAVSKAYEDAKKDNCRK
jgi:hypothetical protein